MMFKKFCCCFSFYLFSVQAFALEWSIYQNFPPPATGAYGVVGTALPDGRLILWNGNQIFVQNTLDADAFTAIASGYIGDPSFISISPDGHTLLLGAGTGDFSNPPAWKDSLYLFDAQAPADYSAATLALVHPHYDGAYLSESLALIDLGKADFSGSELAVVDISTAAKSLQRVLKKASNDAWLKDVIVTKPQFSYSSKITVDRANGIVYVMDGNTLELRFFNVSELIVAYQSQTTLDWETDGTLVGQAGIYFSNGVCGITPTGSLVVSGSLGYLQPGGIQFLNPNLADPSLASILSTEDPAGNNPFYAAMYSAGADRVTAFDYVNWYASAASFNDGAHHSADVDKDGVITLSELMRVIQFFNMGGFSCAPAESMSEDGYFAQGGGEIICAGHTSDYSPHDWQINLSELLRLIQLYQSEGFTVCPQQMTEDGFCPGN